MTGLRSTLAGLLIACTSAAAPALASQDAPTATPGADLAGAHDFDFLAGEWRVHHRRLKQRLAGSHDWAEFEGTCVTRLLMGGLGNVDDNVIELPEGTYNGVGLRSYDPATAQWTIWWLDGRRASADLDPPVRGRFDHGVGTFYANDTLRGKPIRVRYTWSHITASSAQWEQAYSPDEGKTWETNWEMKFERKS